MKRFIVFVCMLIAFSLSPPLLAADSGYNIPDQHFELGQVIVDLKACAECHNLGQNFPKPDKQKKPNDKTFRTAAGLLWQIDRRQYDPTDVAYRPYRASGGGGFVRAVFSPPD